ncbi:MAG: hypothetical protein ACR2F6_03575 [Mycobacteriales bacterium]
MHVYVRTEIEEKVSAWSPQLHGLFVADWSIAEVGRLVAEIARAEYQADPDNFLWYDERIDDVDDYHLVRRLLMDKHAEDRLQALRILDSSLQIRRQRDEILSYPRDRANELVIVPCVGADSAGWLVEQVTEPGDAILAITPVTDSTVWAMQVVNSIELSVPYRYVTDLVGGPETTVTELMETPDRILVRG